MSKLSQVMPKDMLKALLKLGFFVFHQSGSHVRLHHPDGARVTISIHSKPLAKGTFFAILKQAGIPRKDIEELL